MGVRIALATEDRGLQDHLAALVVESPDFDLVLVAPDATSIVEAVDREGVDVIVLDEAMHSVSVAGLTRELVAIRPFLAVAWVVADHRHDVLSQAMMAGARSVLAQPLSVETATATLLSAAEWSRALREHLVGSVASLGQRGRVLAVAGAKGGVGTTLLATLLASESLAPGVTVVLVDLDLRGGNVSFYTDVVARRSIADLAEVSQELTNRSVREVAADHPSGLTLVLAPEDVERADEVTGPAVRQILAQLRAQFDIVVVDCGSRLDDTTAMALEVADDVLLVATADLVALRAARRCVESWRRLNIRGEGGVELVLNRASRRAEVQADLARQIVPVPLAGEIPAGFFSLEPRVNTGIFEGKATPVHAAVARLLGSRAPRPRTSTPPAQSPSAPPAPAGLARRARRSGRARTDSGQVAVELPLVVAGVTGLAVIGAQMLLWGLTHMFVGHASQVAAREAAVTSDALRIRDATLDALPSGWDGASDVAVTRPSLGQVRVVVKTPRLIPWIGDLAVSSTSSVVLEQP